MKTFIRGVLFAALLVCFGCSEQTDITPNIEAKKSLDVKQAKEAFVRDYTAAVEARSETTRAIEHIYYTLADTDYTPLWDKAKNTENDHVLSIDVPLYSVSGAFASDTDSENMRMATQKLIVIQSKKSGDTFSYLLTLCPDVACAEKYSDLNDVFTHLGDCSKFSGLAIYTSLAGELVAVDKFVNGVETGYVYVGNPETDQHALHHQAEHLMEGMKFYLSSGPVEMTRGGGEGDTIYEDLCRYCMKNPCECNYCTTCGRHKAPAGVVDYGACQCAEEYPDICEICGKSRTECKCNTDVTICDKCGQRKPENGKCFFCEAFPEKTCDFCGKSTDACECPNSSVGCPKCGDLTCTGCEGNDNSTTPSNPSNPTDPDESERCPYCDNYCEGHCEAYCKECKQLKTDCTEHRCPSCNELYRECECKQNR